MKRRVELMAEEALAKDRIERAPEWIGTVGEQYATRQGFLRGYVAGALAGRSARVSLLELVDEEPTEGAPLVIAPAEIVLRVNISRAPQPEAARPRLTFEVGDYAGTLSFAECRRIGQLLLSLTSEAPDAEGTDGFAVTLPLANRRKDRDRAVASIARFGIQISGEIEQAFARQWAAKSRERREQRRQDAWGELRAEDVTPLVPTVGPKRRPRKKEVTDRE